MNAPGTAVKSPAERLSRMEARREKLLVVIERAERTFEKHDKAAKRWLKRFVDLRRKANRMDKAITKVKAEAANALVEAATPQPEPEAQPEPAKKRRAKPKVTETTDIPDAEVFGDKLEAALKTELQAANNRLAEAFNDSMNGKGPFRAKGGEPSKEQVAAERAKRMKAAGFHPAKR